MFSEGSDVTSNTAPTKVHSEKLVTRSEDDVAQAVSTPTQGKVTNSTKAVVISNKTNVENSVELPLKSKPVEK